MKIEKNRTALVVLGSHRSGTSSVTRVLNMLGASLPSTLMGASANNQAGYWESTEIRDLNDDLLKNAGSRWDDWTAIPQSWLDDPLTQLFKSQITDILDKEYDGSHYFVLKDPRICRLAPLWIQALVENGITPKVVLPVRKPSDVAASLERRNGFAPSFSRLLWLRHVLDAEYYSREIPRAVISYEDTLHKGMYSFERAGDILGMDWLNVHDKLRDEVNTFLDPSLRHHRNEPDNKNSLGRVSDWEITTYDTMLDWAENGEKKSDYFILDRIRSELNDAASEFNEVVTAGRDAVQQLNKKNQEIAKNRERIKQLEEHLKLGGNSHSIADARTKVLSKRIQALYEMLARELQRGDDIARIASSLIDGRVWPRLTRRSRLRRDRRLLAATGLFNASYYCSKYHDVPRGERNALEHFVLKGLAEGRSPRPAEPHMRPQHQKAVSLDDIALISDSDYFDAEWYRKTYLEIDILKLDPIRHYLEYGSRMGYKPSKSFNVLSYIRANPELLETGCNPLVHFLRSKTPAISDYLPQYTFSEKPTINWVMNTDNVGWAYGNNARAIARQLPQFEHILDGTEHGSDIALYFDIRIFQQRGKLAHRNILRVGGPRPISLAYGDDLQKFKSDISVFDSIIVLNQHLYDMIAPLHADVHLIPNALNLEEWCPSNATLSNHQFTLGFAANINTKNEADIKGHRLVQTVCKEMGIPLITLEKGENSISREEMPIHFYGKIDALIHPVAPNKEGCSNVIMEALALGVPVITTKDAGFHAEKINDEEGILYVERNKEDIVGAIERLRSSWNLQDKMKRKGREFACLHHDITKTAQKYENVFLSSELPKRVRKISFIPFWEPPENFASGRLRCIQPASILSETGRFEATVGNLTGREAAIVISQLASDTTMEWLNSHPDVPMIYDLCDRSFDDDREIGGVNARSRFFELANRATVIVTSTRGLKRAVSSLELGKPVVFLPDGIDYRQKQDFHLVESNGPIIWFGNPGRGNFESSRWMIDHALKNSGRNIRIISRERSFQNIAKKEDPSYKKYLGLVSDWSFETFLDDIKGGFVCLISQDPIEATKSSNRLVTAISNGLPAIVSFAPDSEALLNAAGCSWAIVKNAAELDTALARLSVPEERTKYLHSMLKVIQAKFGDTQILKRYETLLDEDIPGKIATYRNSSLKVLFVSHNLNYSEGAPTSLYETVTGLRKLYDVAPTVFSISDGDLRSNYEAAGIEVVVPSCSKKSSTQKLMRSSWSEVENAFSDLLKSREFDVIVFNTTVSLLLSRLAINNGLPVLGIIRESSEEHVNFNFGPEGIMEVGREALGQLSRLVFVSEHTLDLWAEEHELPPTRLIHNGVDASRRPKFGIPGKESGTKKDARKEIGIPEDGMLLLSVGTISRRKAQKDIIDAVAALPLDQRKNVRIAFVGASPSSYLDTFTEEVARLEKDLASRIHIIPKTDRVDLWYTAADIFVFASHNESYPRVILEAMQYHLPIVSSEVFGAREQIVDGESGLLYRIGDVTELAQKLAFLINSEKERQKIGESASLRVWELTSYHEMVHKYYVLLKNLASQREPTDTTLSSH